MPFFVGNVQFTGDSINSMDITKSAITQSTLDMDMNRITSVHDPIEQQDAVTKKFLMDHLSLAFTVNIVELIGTDPVVISDLDTGSYIVNVFPSEIGAPTATFCVTKTDPSRSGGINRLHAALEGGTTLHVEWLTNQPLTIRKSDNNWNGMYRIKIM